MSGKNWESNAIIRQVRIPSGKGRLSACLHSPEGTARGRVIAFLPLAEERKGCVRPLFELGGILAGYNIELLAFDYSGTGESPGEFSGITWDTLLRDCQAAVSWNRQDAPDHNLAILGIRLGARLALELLPEMDKTIPLALWEPVCKCGKWFNDLRRRSNWRSTGNGQTTDGAVDIDGYLFGSEMVRSIKERDNLPGELNLPECAIWQIGHRSEPAPQIARLAEALGGECDIHCRKMLPFWLESDIPRAGDLLNETADWFDMKLKKSKA